MTDEETPEVKFSSLFADDVDVSEGGEIISRIRLVDNDTPLIEQVNGGGDYGVERALLGPAGTTGGLRPGYSPLLERLMGTPHPSAGQSRDALRERGYES